MSLLHPSPFPLFPSLTFPLLSKTTTSTKQRRLAWELRIIEPACATTVDFENMDADNNNTVVQQLLLVWDSTLAEDCRL